MKKQLLLILMTLLPMLAWADESGTCGDNLTWTYYESTHSLVITGSGDMYNYSNTWNGSEYVCSVPWYKYCGDMVSVILPDGLTSIGDYVFYECSSLTSMTIPNSVTSIGNSAFSGCSSLTSVSIPNSVTSIGDGAFAGCSSLSSVTIPNSVTSIGNSAFSGCSSLTSVSIPNSVTAIGYFAFYNCSSLAAVIISNNVTTIGDMTFCNCSKLTSVTIPNSVISVRLWAFMGCSSLTSVTIGNSVKSIGEKAFEDCSGLTSVTCLNPQPPTCYTNTFPDYSIPLYVPQGSTLQYKAAEGWRNFVIIRELNGDDDIYLTINDGAKGNIEIKVDKENPYMTLRVQPESGWHIYSMTFNGETVTGEIDSDGTYTTPVINENSDLNIVYAQGASSAPSLENPHIHFTSTENSILINGTTGGESISVCSLDGKCLAKVVASGYTTEIPLYTHQTYLIKINHSVFKVSM